MSLHKFLLVFFGLLTVVFVEFRTRVLLGRSRVPSRAEGAISAWIRRDARPDIAHRLAGCPITASPALPCSPTRPGPGSDVRDTKRRRWKERQYVDAAMSPMSFKSLEPRRFLDLRSRCSVTHGRERVGSFPTTCPVPPSSPSLLILANSERARRSYEIGGRPYPSIMP